MPSMCIKTMHGFNCDDILRWANLYSRTYHDARNFAHAAGANEIDTLKLVIVAFVKTEEKSRDVDAASKEVAAMGGYMKRNLGDYTPNQLRAIALLMEVGKL